MKVPHRLLLGVASATALAVSLAVSLGAPAARGIGPPLPSTGLPLPSTELPLPTVSLPLPSVPIPTASLPVPTPSLPLPTVSLPLPTVSAPLPSLGPLQTAPPGTPGPSAESPIGGPGGRRSSDDGGVGSVSLGPGPDAPGDATRAGLQVPPVLGIPPSLPTVGSWLVPSLGVAVPALFVAVLVLIQVLTGAAGVRATRGLLDRVGSHVPPWLRRTDAASAGPGQR